MLIRNVSHSWYVMISSWFWNTDAASNNIHQCNNKDEVPCGTDFAYLYYTRLYSTYKNTTSMKFPFVGRASFTFIHLETLHTRVLESHSRHLLVGVLITTSESTTTISDSLHPWFYHSEHSGWSPFTINQFVPKHW